MVIRAMLRLTMMLSLLTATAVEAQRPGMGTFGRGRAPGKLTIEPGIEVAKPVNVINLVVENRTPLVLSDSQYMRVLTIKRRLDSANAPAYRRIDSVQRLFKPGPVFADPSPQRRDSVAAARAIAREMVAEIEEHIAEAREQAIALMSASQLTKIEELEEKARKAGAAPPRGRF
jgi:hypothetical protein